MREPSVGRIKGSMLVRLLFRVLALSSLTAAPQMARAATFHVDAQLGVDLPGGGSQPLPWRTLTYTLAQAPLGFGDRIELAEGTYDDALGEVFPLQLPSGVSLVGAGAHRTRITALTPPSKGYLLLVAVGTGDLSGMSIEGIHFDAGASAAIVLGANTGQPGGPVLRRNRFEGYWAGIVVTHDVILEPARTTLDIRLGHVIEGNVFVRNQAAIYEDFFIGGFIRAGFIDESAILNNVFLDNDVGISQRVQRFEAPLCTYPLTRIVNNTFVGSLRAAVLLDNSAACSAPRVANNIFAAGGIGIQTNATTVFPEVRMGANLFDRATRVLLKVSQLEITDIAQVNLYPSHDPAPAPPSLWGDPLLRPQASGALRLAPGSPAIDAGSGADAPGRDFDADPRPLDGNADGVALFDIGADERGTGVDLHRAVLSSRAPRTPDLASVYPFTATNPLTPLQVRGFQAGDVDPDAGILERASLPLVLYALVPATDDQLVAVKDRSSDSLRFDVR